MHALDMILNFFRDGGIFLYPLALIWVVGLVIAFERFGFIMRVGAGNRRMWAEVQPLLKKVITDPRIVTPTGKFNVWNTQNDIY